MAGFRLLAWILVALALMLLGADGISTLEQGEPVVRTTAEILGLFGLQIAPAGEGGVGSVANFFLDAPLWAILGVIGIVLTLLFRPID
jgi:hypothetical protein